MAKNQVEIEGRFSRDPDAPQFASGGNPVLRVLIAFAQPGPSVGWVGVICFGELAQKVSQFKKGDGVRVVGNLTWLPSGPAPIQIIASSIERIVLPGEILKYQSGRAASDPRAPSERPVFSKARAPSNYGRRTLGAPRQVKE